MISALFIIWPSLKKERNVETTMTPDVNIVLLDFRDRPGREMVVENEDGSFTIIINSRLSTQGQRDAY